MTNLELWILQVPGWVFLIYLVVAQCLSAVSYALGVRMGTQEPSESITPVGVAFFKGFAGADLVFYVPLLAAGLAGHAVGAGWSGPVLAAAFGITIYWPIVCLWAVVAARDAPGWHLPKERQYLIVLPLISLWGVAALVVLMTT